MITINLDKAKEVTHTLRRDARSKEFAPLDIKATIPMEAEQAELQRSAIRNKYTELQITIDSANSVDELKTLVESL